MSIKLKDIADEAQVSVAAVSLVLNNKPGVGEKTRKKVLEIANRNGYELPSAKTLPKVEKGTIRFIKLASHGKALSLDSEIFITDYIDGLTHSARVHGYSLEIGSFSRQNIDEAVHTLNSSSVAGAIVMGTELDYEDLKHFEQINAPTVCFDTYFDFLQVDFIDMNNIDAVHKIVSFLHDKGHREVGMIKSRVKTKNFLLREKDFTKAMKHLALPIREENILPVDSTFTGAYEDMKKLLGGERKPPPALFACNDILAFGSIKAFKEAGLSIPEDVSIVGFGDLPLSDIMGTALTTIKVPKREMGELAMDIVIKRIEGDIERPPIKILISGQFIDLDSVKDLMR